MSRPTARALTTTTAAVATALLALLPTSGAQTLDIKGIKGSDSITVACHESSIPFSHLVDKAQPTGSGWEICMGIVDEVRRATGRADHKVTTPAARSANPRERAVMGGSIQVEPSAILLHKDDPNFMALFEGVLARQMDSGEFERLYTRRFQSPMPPKGVNLNAPMPTEPRDNLKTKPYKPAT